MAAPVFPTYSFNAPDRYIGATSDPLPCVPGDVITLTATIQYVSGIMQPIIGVWFWDATQTTNLGSLRICPPNTDNGWHLYTFTVLAPVGAQLMTVQSYCEYLDFAGPVSAQTLFPILSQPFSQVVPVSNTTNMVVGETITLSGFSTGGGHGRFVSTQTIIAAINPGVSFSAVIDTQFDAGANVVNTFVTSTESSYFVGFTTVVAPAPLVPPNFVTQWAISNYRVSQNGNDVAMLLTYFSPSLTAYWQTQQFNFACYYLSLMTSRTKTAPNWYAATATLLTPVIDLLACTLQMSKAFDLSTPPVGPQLDIIGSIVGASRQLPFQPTGGASAILTDSDYLVLIKAKIARNQWDGKVGSLYALWNSLFPGAYMLFEDGGLTGTAMTATVIIAAPQISSIQLQMIENDMILPRSQSVLYTFVTATMPFFGADQNNATVAGADLGHVV